ncbi:MAG: nucleotidyltransferase domain-containing protein [Bacteroidetes bacterium]|nr:nucleotidyltransferase domain-containing protein [Bacteroidota bacterium]
MDRRKQILAWIKETLDKHLSGVNYDAFVFGSQANKSSLIRADIDIGIICESKIPMWRFSNILSDLEKLPMLYKIDLVDFRETEEEFRLVALQNTEKL